MRFLHLMEICGFENALVRFSFVLINSNLGFSNWGACSFGEWKVRKGVRVWQRHIFQKRDNAKYIVVLFLCLILRLGEAEISTTNAKGGATENI